MPKKETRVRGWCFTVQSHDDEAAQAVSTLFEEDVKCSYLIIGYEIAPRTKQPHLQCYAYYPNKITFEYIKQQLQEAHIEPQKSKKNVAAYCYCMQEYQYVEWGDRPRQGNRTDLEVIKCDLLTKKNDLKGISKDYFSQYCQYKRPFEAFIDMHNIRPKYDTKLIVYDKDTIRKIYTDYDPYYYFIYEDFYFGQYSLLHKYHSGLYKQIFVPNTPGIEDYNEFVDETLF